MRLAILDTNIYIDHWERGLHAETLSTLRHGYILRQSAVVLSELRRGARTKHAQQLVEHLRKASSSPVWEPSSNDWWKAGALIQQVGEARKWEVTKRREFQNDALIALTAVHHGASLITTNAKDFKLLEALLPLKLVVLPRP